MGGVATVAILTEAGALGAFSDVDASPPAHATTDTMMDKNVVSNNLIIMCQLQADLGRFYQPPLPQNGWLFQERCPPLSYLNMSLSGERIRSQWVAVSVDW